MPGKRVVSVVVDVKSTGGRLQLGACNGPLVFNVEEIFEEGIGISILGRLACGAVSGRFLFSLAALDLVPKQEQNAERVGLIFFPSDLVSISCLEGY